MRIRLFSVVMLLTSVTQAQSPTPPCAAPEYRQFDFWVGSWDLYTPDGRQAGHNEISIEYGGCVLHERYQAAGKYRGESLNTYDPGRKVWHQTWVDNAGTLLQLEGGWDGEVMQLTGITQNTQGEKTWERIRWSKNADHSVRQLWEQSTDGKVWKVAFDGEYRPVSRSSKP